MSTDTLPRDEFSTRLRALSNNPAAIRSSSTISISDDYGNTATWIVDGFRYDGRDELLLQRIAADERAIRMVVPPRVMAAIISQRERANKVTRRRAATKALQTKRDRGIDPAAAIRGKGGRKKGGRS
jgi:hypothetical protein